MSNLKKQTDLNIFIIGWVASALSVGVPTLILILIKHYYPNAATDYGDKTSIIAYLSGAFFSGLFTTYRVVCKSKDKDLELQDKNQRIQELERNIEDTKKAYRSLSPQRKIISLLLDLQQESKSLSKQDYLQLIMKKIKEINSDTTFEPRYDGMLTNVNDSDYKKESNTTTTQANSNNKKYSSIDLEKNIFFKNSKF